MGIEEVWTLTINLFEAYLGGFQPHRLLFSNSRLRKEKLAHNQVMSELETYLLHLSHTLYHRKGMHKLPEITESE